MADAGTFKKIVAAPAGHALIVTSVDLDVYTASLTGIGHNVEGAVSQTNNTCSSVVSDPASHLTALDFNPGTIGMTVIPLQPGLVVPANRALCVVNADTTHVNVEVFVFGYQVPAGAAAAGAAVLGADTGPVNARTQQR